ncbi:PREDICTED: heat shock factor protein 2-like [Ceratosolen solmsi marchali]|uniref:Heat shock factor protein 2-like n=1 Tax=Ceratosolen solmsi marchali TaxID=326594 RepID=A0AAJ6VKZ7_9HYME|nr:PREDICTED: heat shock factor protein 2-like [Ceratosolen solmsi marchali]
MSSDKSSLSTEPNSNDECVIPSLRFPQKLWRIVNECRTGAITWGANGLTVLLSYKSFQEEYLHCENSIFKTTNIASFIRQLNLYGFRKVTSHNRDLCNGTTAFQDDIHEFLHEHFRSGRLDLLSRVCRKTGVKKSLLQAKQGIKQEILTTAVSQNRTSGMTRLQMCQIALTKALEQATRQYRREKFWLQLSNVSKDALKPKYKTKILEPNIQIIFQDLTEMQDVENLPMLDPSSIENIDYQDKNQWEQVFTLSKENSISVP